MNVLEEYECKISTVNNKNNEIESTLKNPRDT